MTAELRPLFHPAFHPAVERWFRSTLGEPTRPQREGWPAIRAGGDTLVAAPTGSGKTLAAFLCAIDDLVTRGLSEGLGDGTCVVYVSPLKALGNDIEKNLRLPLGGIASELAALGLPPVPIRVMVRSGDTPAKERTAMTSRPPHVLVTTPESLYIMLTSGGGRRMLQSARTVIVDEIHALVQDKRGSHLALSLERLDALVAAAGGARPQRIGLSATQRPIEDVARFLVGAGAAVEVEMEAEREAEPRCTIVDAGHVRELDVAIEVPRSPLEAVMSGEVWRELEDRLTELIEAHRTTLVFVNTRRLSERLARQLSERLGEGAVTAHHGSLSREHRREAEQRLKEGKLRALVATASLELGIDIGDVELVCQVGSTARIATLLQRVGRSGHHLRGVPRGRLFPLSRDQLIEAIALCDAVRRGELDRLSIPEAPIDILAQQLVAACAAEDWSEDDLYALVRRAWPYRALERGRFDEVVQMLAEGFATRRGRRSAHLHHDGVNRRLRARRGARLAAITSGGAIPDTADYEVVLEPESARVGTVNEDFAIESMQGDIFQLGNTSYRILRVEPGTVRVEDARGEPPTIPFWLGEAPARSLELSQAVSRIRSGVAERLAEGSDAAQRWMVGELGVGPAAAREAVDHLAAAHAALGALPTVDTLIAERFFDEMGTMHLVLHAPLGSRLNRAFGLALRKCFCRRFNFELQAAANEDAIVLSLGPTHSFPLEEIWGYLNSVTVRDVLVQALLAAPMFALRWRWNVGRALAVLRFRGGRKVPPRLQRMDADDLLTVCFPEQVACLENLPGERTIPDHPLVQQTISDCLTEAMDVDGLEQLVRRFEEGTITLLARDLAEPSPLAAEILAARPYAFLDDAPLEERRTQAVRSRRWLDPETASDLGALDAAAIIQVREQAWPAPRDADELHDALVMLGCLTPAEALPWRADLAILAASRRAAALTLPVGSLWVAAERLPELQALHPDAVMSPPIEAPPRLLRAWQRDDALREVLRGRLEGVGPTNATSLARDLLVDASDIDAALIALEVEGFVLRGRFTPGLAPDAEIEWCERRLLARIHRYTLGRLRREIEPVTPADFLRFLTHWQRLDRSTKSSGPEGLAAVVDQLDGFEAAAVAWERDVLPARCDHYDPIWLDTLCLSGRVSWARRSGEVRVVEDVEARSIRPVRSTPITLMRRASASSWLQLRDGADVETSGAAAKVLAALAQRGACFADDLTHATGLGAEAVDEALAELVARGAITSDGFGGLRALVARGRRRDAARGGAGRWALLPAPVEVESTLPDAAVDVEVIAKSLLRRWGVVFRRVVDREGQLPPWRDLLRVYRRLEARGEIRGGRFVNGFSGEQYALAEAVELLRKVRRLPARGELVTVSAADPLNLSGIIAPGPRVPAIAKSRVLLRDGLPIAALEAGELRWLDAGARAAHEREPSEVTRMLERAPARTRAALPPTAWSDGRG
jgi:ATP-dependent Lhr-like helicase